MTDPGFKIEFSGKSFDEVKVKIQEFCFYHLNMRMRLKGDPPKRPRGRPKMSAEEHLRPKDSLAYEELRELLTRTFEACGKQVAIEVLSEFHVEQLSDLNKKDYLRFKRALDNRLQEQIS